MEVVVTGGGVIGLTTAIRLQESGFDTQILTKALPSETTSIVAAAVWYPYKAYPEGRVLGWGKRSFEVFEELAEDSATGVVVREGVELFREPAPPPWWQDAVPVVRRCDPEELPPGCRDGYAFPAPVAEMPIYLRYLLNRFRRAGGRVERRAVASLAEVAGEGRAVVDCAGIGARELAEDLSVVPIRGQVVRVANPGLETFLLDEENPAGVTYVVPRTSDCILGGTAEEDRWDTEPDSETAEAILQRCAELEPRLAGAEVLEHKVGLRPGRPSVRLERDGDYDGATVIHNYGHGGSGVTLSWGCAEEVLDLLHERA